MTTRTSDAVQPHGPRVLLVGGSVATGLGVRNRPFGYRVRFGRGAEPEYLDLTASGAMIDEALADADRIEAFRPTHALICAGMSERLVHAPLYFQTFLNRYAPETWHGVAGLQPRTYYSTSRARRWRQRALSQLKVSIKRFVLRFGHTQRMDLKDFESHLIRLLDMLAVLGSRVVVVGPWQLDDRLFPRTGASYDKLAILLRDRSADYSNVEFLDSKAHLRTWDDFLDDRCHWNEQGHDKIALAIESQFGMVTGDDPLDAVSQ